MVLYDSIIFLLALGGIATLFVFTYKIAHSRVQVVGIVREISEGRFSVDNEISQKDSVGANEPRAPDVKSTAGTPLAVGKKIWCCEKCGLVQYIAKDQRCRRCQQEFSPPVAVTIEASPESDVEQTIAEYGKALESHHKLIQDFDKRIRQLELESVTKAQETGEDRLQTVGAEFGEVRRQNVGPEMVH